MFGRPTAQVLGGSVLGRRLVSDQPRTKKEWRVPFAGEGEIFPNVLRAASVAGFLGTEHDLRRKVGQVDCSSGRCCLLSCAVRFTGPTQGEQPCRPPIRTEIFASPEARGNGMDPSAPVVMRCGPSRNRSFSPAPPPGGHTCAHTRSAWVLAPEEAGWTPETAAKTRFRWHRAAHVWVIGPPAPGVPPVTGLGDWSELFPETLCFWE